MNITLPPLAQYKSRRDYQPQYGDYIVWSRIWATWHGFVIDHNKKADEIRITFAGVPFLLLTMTDGEIEKEARTIRLSNLRNAINGKFAIQQFDKNQNAIIWYI